MLEVGHHRGAPGGALLAVGQLDGEHHQSHHHEQPGLDKKVDRWAQPRNQHTTEARTHDPRHIPGDGVHGDGVPDILAGHGVGDHRLSYWLDQGLQHPGDAREQYGIHNALLAGHIPRVHADGKSKHHNRQRGLHHQDQFAAVHAVGEDPGEGANEEEREGPHPTCNANPEGRVRNLPDHPGHGNLLKPTGRGVTQVAEPEVEEIAVPEGNEHLHTPSASLTPRGRGCGCSGSFHTCRALGKGRRGGGQVSV